MALGMTHDELLDRLDANDIADYKAYEMATGPIGTGYADNLLAEIHEALQHLTHVFGAGTWGEDNPIKPKQSVARPSDVFDKYWHEAQKKLAQHDPADDKDVIPVEDFAKLVMSKQQ